MAVGLDLQTQHPRTPRLEEVPVYTPPTDPDTGTESGLLTHSLLPFCGTPGL